MTAIPRSASATLTHTLARAIGAPVVHTSVGRFPDYFLVPSWLDMVMEGGAITQDHFSASDFNVGVLSGRRLRNVFVLIRDPRAAARSQVHFLAREGNDTGALGQLSVGRGRIPWLQLRIERECIDNFVPWLQGWINLAKQTDLPFRVHFLTYREVCEDLAAAICKIATILQGHHPAMSAYATCRTVEEVRMHFVSGNDQAWRAEVDDETRERLWAACTSDMKSLLELER
jgi:hypothetical protein